MPFITQGKTNIKYLFVVIILAILAGGLMVGIFKMTECPCWWPSSQPQQVLPIDETADWQTYKNEEHGFEIKYPSVLENGEPGCRISEIEDTIFIGPISLMFFDAQGLTLNEWIDRKISESEEDTKEMQETLKQAGNENWQEFGSKLLSREEIFIAGERAIKLSYQFIGAGFDLPVTISVKKGDRIYDFRTNDANLVDEECAAKFGKKPSEFMEQMLSTFRFIETTPERNTEKIIPEVLENIIVKEIKETYEPEEITNITFLIESTDLNNDGEKEFILYPDEFFSVTDSNIEYFANHLANRPIYIYIKKQIIYGEKYSIFMDMRLKLRKKK